MNIELFFSARAVQILRRDLEKSEEAVDRDPPHITWDPFEGGPESEEQGGAPPVGYTEPETGSGIVWIGTRNGEGLIEDIVMVARGTRMIHRIASHVDRGSVVVSNRPADREVISKLGEAGAGLVVVDDGCCCADVVLEPSGNRSKVLIDQDRLTALLKLGGLMSECVDGYEERSEQLDLLRMIIRAFNTPSAMVAEAGTGVGKSLAYLLPAIEWTRHNKERVVISTATIALQQQLIEKDIPLACELLETENTSILVKGRGNYLCLKRLNEAGSEESDLFSEGLESIRLWAGETDKGSLSELPFKPEAGLWDRVRCEAESCPGSLCRFYDSCFFMRSRRCAAAASVLVVNHHLLFATWLRAGKKIPGTRRWSCPLIRV